VDFFDVCIFEAKNMRWFIALIFIATAAALPVILLKEKPTKQALINSANKPAATDEATLLRLKSFGTDAQVFATANHLNTRYCFLIDMKLPSGKNRFFVYDLKGDTTVVSGLVTHGSGKVASSEIQFSNTPESNCTSLGKYKIGNAYNGKFGLAYKLYGLDKTNSNAFNRFVVLHSHACVPLMEVAPQQICDSWGCPTVAPLFLQVLTKYINKADKPLLMWIYN